MVVLVLVVLREEGQLIGEDWQPLLVREDAHSNQFGEQSQIHTQLTRVTQLQNNVKPSLSRLPVFSFFFGQNHKRLTVHPRAHHWYIRNGLASRNRAD